MDDALLRGARELRLRRMQRLRSRFRVLGGERFLDLADKVRISLRRDLLTSVRRMVWRAAFWADWYWP